MNQNLLPYVGRLKTCNNQQIRSSSYPLSLPKIHQVAKSWKALSGLSFTRRRFTECRRWDVQQVSAPNIMHRKKRRKKNDWKFKSFPCCCWKASEQASDVKEFYANVFQFYCDCWEGKKRDEKQNGRCFAMLRAIFTDVAWWKCRKSRRKKFSQPLTHKKCLNCKLVFGCNVARLEKCYPNVVVRKNVINNISKEMLPVLR